MGNYFKEYTQKAQQTTYILLGFLDNYSLVCLVAQNGVLFMGTNFWGDSFLIIGDVESGNHQSLNKINSDGKSRGNADSNRV